MPRKKSPRKTSTAVTSSSTAAAVAPSDSSPQNKNHLQREQQQQQALEDADENTLRIMVTTDSHLGYMERDAVRGDDSFAAFEEVLYVAKRTFHADMVLHAGDLFHENKPTRSTLYKTMKILRKYTMGHEPVQLQLMSDPTSSFASGQINYEDQFTSVDLPVFSIHGNHDDPTREAGDNTLAALDLLSVANLVNYVGKKKAIEYVEITPTILRKGTTHIALYTLGAMRDERLRRMFVNQKVRFIRPEEDADDEEDGFFNIFVIHQNRHVGRGLKNSIDESWLPDWLNLVIWGHEHECVDSFQESVGGIFRILQPGSSVATSLVEGERVRKNAFVVDVRGKQFRMHSTPLTQVRPFVFREIDLVNSALDPDDPKVDKKIAEHLEEEVRVAILDALDERKDLIEAAHERGNFYDTQEDADPGHKMKEEEQVLVRLRVLHKGFATIGNQRFSAKFLGSVANPNDILLFKRIRQASAEPKSKKKVTAMNPIDPEDLEENNINSLVKDILGGGTSSKGLSLIKESELSKALEEYVDKNSSSAINEIAFKSLKGCQVGLLKGQKPPKATKDASDGEDGEGSNAPSRQNATSRGSKKRPPPDESSDDSENDLLEKENHRKRLQAKTTDNPRRMNERRLEIGLDDGGGDGGSRQGRRSPRKGRIDYSGMGADSDSDPIAEFDENEDSEDDMVADESPRQKAPTRTKKNAVSRRAAAIDLDSDEDFQNSNVDISEDWGTAATRSQRY